MGIEDGNAFMDYKDTCSCPTSGFTSVLHQMPSFQSHRPGDSHSEHVKSIWHDGLGYGLSKSTDVCTY